MNAFNRFLEYKHTTIILSALIFVCSLFTLYSFKDVEQHIRDGASANTLSRYMGQSSDDLTNYARYYVTTRNPEWKTAFNRVLDVRNGVVEGPDGVKKSLKDRVAEQHFLKEEIDILLRAEQLSNNLAKLEVEAFDLVEKWRQESPKDPSGEYSGALLVKAQMLLFGDAYKEQKKAIMETSHKFYEAVNKRMYRQYNNSMTAAWVSIIITNISLLLIVLVAIHKPAVTTKKPAPAVKKAPAKTRATAPTKRR